MFVSGARDRSVIRGSRDCRHAGIRPECLARAFRGYSARESRRCYVNTREEVRVLAPLASAVRSLYQAGLRAVHIWSRLPARPGCPLRDKPHHRIGGGVVAQRALLEAQMRNQGAPLPTSPPPLRCQWRFGSASDVNCAGGCARRQRAMDHRDPKSSTLLLPAIAETPQSLYSPATRTPLTPSRRVRQRSANLLLVGLRDAVLPLAPGYNLG
jgi:hypothetical protein